MMAKTPQRRKTRAAAEVLPARRVARLDLRCLQALVLEKRSPAYVARVLENSDLPPVTAEELASIGEALRPPTGFKPRSLSHKASVAFLDGVGLTPYFRDAPEWKIAMMMLNTPRARELVEAALLCHAPLAEIVKMLRVYLKHVVSTSAVELYERVFFDSTCASRSELRALVNARVRQCLIRALGSECDKGVLELAVAADGRSIAATLPAALLGWPAVLLALGYEPLKIKLGTMLDKTAEVAAIRSASLVLRGGEVDAQVAERFTSVLVKLRQVRESINQPDEELNKKLRQFQLVRSTTRVMTAAQLLAQGGSMTVDVGPPTTTLFDVRDGSEDELENDGNIDSATAVTSSAAADIDPSAADVA